MPDLTAYEDYHWNDDGTRPCPGCGATWRGQLLWHSQGCGYIAWLDAEAAKDEEAAR